jgi:putative ABC transport system substrate-binding protein
MRRRDFIKVIGGATAAWPLAARAQQPAVPVIGFLRSTGAFDSEHLVTAFRAGLRETGFVEGQNVAIEYRYADNDLNRLPELAADLIRRQVAVIVANNISAIAAKAATQTVPIVFGTGSDPIKDGLVASFNRPGGNVTGVAFFAGVLGAKRLELLRQLVPRATTIAMLVNPSTNEARTERADVETAAQTSGLKLISVEVKTNSDIDAAFATFAERRADALFVGSGGFMNAYRQQLVALAARYALPASYSVREATELGGLMSYTASITDAYRQVGVYAGRILKGEKPADLPVIRSTKLEFLINLKTAKALGLAVPPSLLALADEVIE